MSTIKDLQSTIDQKRGQQSQIKKSLEEAKQRKESSEVSLQDHEKARDLIKQAALKTQENLAFHISDITSLALQAVFDDPYELKVEFVQRRNKTECDLLFEKNGETFQPLDASGGGVVDVASFALRIASWAMEIPRSRKTIILDEPMRFLSSDLQTKASTMIKEISQKLGLQFIIITHEEQLTEDADRIFIVEQNKNISNVIQQS